MFSFSCNAKCFEKLSGKELDENYERFYSLDNKDSQDIFLQGLINIRDIQRRRARVQIGNKPKAYASEYHVYKGSVKEKVCLSAFTSVYGITPGRVRRVRDLGALGKSPKDKRGKNPSINKLGEDVQLAVRHHIESFPVKLSHYANREIKYLNSDLNLKIMFHLFTQRHPEMKISYSYYTRYFRENFSLRFGRPQVDVCSTCETLNNKIKDHNLNETARRVAAAELMVHKRRSKKFYSQLKKERESSSDSVLALSFDFMQNVQLPKTPVGEIFYYQQLTISVFCIHNITNNTAKMYIYHEGEAKKTANEVCSFLLDYVKDIPEYRKELHLYSDNCWGQNKNHTVVRMLLALTDIGRFSKIIHYFPIRGHSFLPCDRDFAMVKRKLRKCDRIFTIHQITELIITSSTSNKFTVKEVKTDEIINFTAWWPNFYKKNCISEGTISNSVPRNSKAHFNISTYSEFIYDTEKTGCVQVLEFIQGALNDTFKLQKTGRSLPVLPSTAAYVLGKVPIKSSKMEHISKCARFVSEEYQPFYAEILRWPTIS